MNRFKKKLKYKRTKIFQGKPHCRGMIKQMLIRTPKKPNSSKRKIVRVLLKFSKKLQFANIPGEGYNLTTEEYKHVMVSGRNTRDIPRCFLRLVRGVYSFWGVEGRVSRRSTYGIKKKKKK